jgi:hypothetical protein
LAPERVPAPSRVHRGLGALTGEIEPVNRSRFGRADHPFTFLGAGRAGIFNIANGAPLLAPAILWINFAIHVVLATWARIRRGDAGNRGGRS